MQPLVSVIIPCYNAEKWIAEALESVLSQTYARYEIVIIDDGSTDKSQKIIQDYALKREQITYELTENRGASAARNRGLDLAQGDYILFFDADDLLELDTISALIATIGGRTDVIAACPWWSIEWDGIKWKRFYHRYSQAKDPLIGELRYGDYIPLPALLWPRQVVDSLGPWDETLTINDDGDYRLRARLYGYTFVYAQHGGFVYRRHSQNSLSGRRNYRGLESSIRVLEKVETILVDQKRLEEYRLALGCAFHRLASSVMPYNELLGERALQHAIRLGGIRTVQGPLRHRLICYSLGLKRKERLAKWLADTPIANLLGRAHLQKLKEYDPE